MRLQTSQHSLRRRDGEDALLISVCSTMAVRKGKLKMLLRFSVPLIQESENSEVVSVSDLVGFWKLVEGYSNSLILDPSDNILAESQRLQLSGEFQLDEAQYKRNKP